MNGSNSLADSKAGALIIEYPAAFFSMINPISVRSFILASSLAICLASKSRGTGAILSWACQRLSSCLSLFHIEPFRAMHAGQSKAIPLLLELRCRNLQIGLAVPFQVIR